MTKSNSCICLFPLFPLFNDDRLPLFESMNSEDSALLYSILYENYIEVLREAADNSTIIYCLDGQDKDKIPENLTDKGLEIQWIDTNELNSELKNLNEKYFKKFSNNLLIFAHSIGVSYADIKKIFTLLEMDDESIMLGRDGDERVALLGFNSYNEEIMGSVSEDRNHYNELLIRAGKHDNFVHTLSNFMIIENKNDFKKLYEELSRKESLNYCNQIIHEKFTHLFIEYKELLK